MICDNEVVENWRRKKIVVMELLKIGGKRERNRRSGFSNVKKNIYIYIYIFFFLPKFMQNKYIDSYSKKKKRNI